MVYNLARIEGSLPPFKEVLNFEIPRVLGMAFLLRLLLLTACYKAFTNLVILFLLQILYVKASTSWK